MSYMTTGNSEDRALANQQRRDDFDSVAEAFSRKAGIYDAFGENHVNMSRMRKKFYDHIQSVMLPGGYLLELNAGTGQDAVALVERGFRIHATDIAPGMLAQIEDKITRFGLEDRLTFKSCSFTQLEQVTEGPFDGIYSNSGGLNCIADLTAVTRSLPALLRPGARVTWVIMPKICPWELGVILKDYRVGTRRLHRNGIMAHVEGVHFMTYYHTAAQVEQAFGPRFRQVKLEGLSVFTPTADNKTFAINHSRFYKQLVQLDDLLSTRRPFNGWGDFFILTMELIK
jgi:ubiquinone/menaquinone biosynthesis C-methylase UbiE